MLRLALTPRWLGFFALAAVFAVTCVFLGRWQWSRYVDRSSTADLVSRHYTAPPIALDRVLPARTPLDPSEEWRRVTATGRYLGETLFVRNRPQNVVYGYEVLAPLLLGDGSVLVVDRGWVRNAERADILPRVPAAPGGDVTVTGWLRSPEPSLGKNLPAGQLASIDLEEVASDLNIPTRSAYLVLDREQVAGQSGTPPRPEPLLPPDTGTGPHFAYALQWWLAAPVGAVVAVVYLRREARDQAVLARGGLPGGPGAPAHPARPPKVKKKRIWDEEDE